MVDKASFIEYIENMYGLSNTSLRRKYNRRLEELLKSLELLEREYILSDSKTDIQKYEALLIDTINEMEIIINE